MKTKGPVKPIYTSNPKDPRIQRYNDSMTMHNAYKGNISALKKETSALRAADFSSRYKKSSDARQRLDYPEPEKSFQKKIQGVTTRAWEYKEPVQPVVYKKAAKVAAPKTTAKAKPTSKPVEKTKPVVKKPENIVMKPVSEEDSNALKAGFKKQTGQAFKSKDSDYNKLEKKLGRKPTVAEYNKSIKKS
jgi:hypothetical protein